MLSLTSVSVSEVVIGDVADKFQLPCQRVHAVTVTVCRRPDSNRRWLMPALKVTDLLDQSATTQHHYNYSYIATRKVRTWHHGELNAKEAQTAIKSWPIYFIIRQQAQMPAHPHASVNVLLKNLYSTGLPLPPKLFDRPLTKNSGHHVLLLFVMLFKTCIHTSLL